MNTDDISKLAEEERKRQENKTKKSWFNREEAPVFRRKSPESWFVYSRIYPYHFNLFIWIYIVMTIGVVFLSMYYMDETDVWSFYVGIIALGIFGVRMLYHQTAKIIRFSGYKKWRQTLPFKLTGWDKLGSFKYFPAGRYWNTCSLKVVLRPGTNYDSEKVVKDALFLLCVEANKCFYEGWSGMDGRSKWEADKKERTMVAGSANSAAVGDMYKCIDKWLRAIHNQYNCIEKVEVVFSDTVREVSPKSTD